MKRFPLAGFLLFALFPLGAQSFSERLGFSLRLSMLVFPEDNGNVSGPAPILPSPGGTVSYTFNDLLSLELSLDLYGTEYDYSYQLNRAVPANQEFRSSFIVGSLWGLQPVLYFRPGKTVGIRAYGGLAFDARICFLAWDVNASQDHQDKNKYSGAGTVGEASSDIFSYFWGGGRWLFPFAGGGVDFAVLGGIRLGLDFRVWFPLWRLWTGENAPFIEGFRFGAGFRATFK